MPSFQKTSPIRSKALVEAYRRIPCQWDGCGNPETACAHANWSEYGKAGARKADDIYGASLCWRHHRELDQGSSLSYDERKTGWIAAHEKTMATLIALSWEQGEHKLRKLLAQVGIIKA